LSQALAKTVSLTPDKRVLFLTRDPDLVRRQLRGELDLRMKDLRVEDLLDDINTDAMAPAWACFDYRPEDVAKNAYAGMTVGKERLFPEGSLAAGNFEVVVSGYRKGVGSSREQAVQAEKWAGIRIAIAASFAPIHARNNVAQGVLMADHAVLVRLQAGEAVPKGAFTRGLDPVTRLVVEHGGLFAFTEAYRRGEVALPALDTAPRPMTMAEKVLAAHVVAEGEGSGRRAVFVKPGDAVCVRVDGGYSHEFTSAQVDYFLEQQKGAGYRLVEIPVNHRARKFGQSKYGTLPKYCMQCGAFRLLRRVPAQPLHQDARRRGGVELPVRRLQGILHSHPRADEDDGRPPA
jgi:3-isopropylmalate/(R)-2-methylmalate dehydratase large subunit